MAIKNKKKELGDMVYFTYEFKKLEVKSSSLLKQHSSFAEFNKKYGYRAIEIKQDSPPYWLLKVFFDKEIQESDYEDLHDMIKDIYGKYTIQEVNGIRKVIYLKEFDRGDVPDLK